MSLEQRHLAFGFIDIISFGKLAKERSPEATAKLIKEFYDNVALIMNRNGVSVGELGGDSALVFSANPKSFVNGLNELRDWASKSFHPVKIKAGYGEIFLFDITSGNYSAQKIFGDAINETYKLSGNDFILSSELQKLLY